MAKAVNTNYFSDDTIAAIATSIAGDAGVGIIRVSGPNALLVSQKYSQGLENPSPRYAHRIRVIDQQSKEELDDGLAIYFPKGESFTGEEVVELQLHGGRFLLQKILSLLCSSGQCRLAKAGEFSFRAVQNGKISIQQAESIHQLVKAKSLFEVKVARNGIGKRQVELFRTLLESTHNLLAQSELSIDFSDQDVEVISTKKIIEILNQNISAATNIKNQLLMARKIAKGIQITIIGKPNAGKSTLFNKILLDDRAIVSEIAGTTRDVITEEIHIGPYAIRLADTAGLRSTSEKIESEGIVRAKELIEQSDLVIYLVDITNLEFDSVIDNTNSVLVLTKADLISVEKNDKIKLETQKKFPSTTVITHAKDDSVEMLLKTIQTKLEKVYNLGQNIFLANDTQIQMLSSFIEHNTNALGLVSKNGFQNPELISSELHSAANSLAECMGETTPDLILNKIFSEFCIGK